MGWPPAPSTYADHDRSYLGQPKHKLAGTEPNMTQAFISYARADEDAAKRLANELTQRGIQVRSMDNLVSPGESWVPELQNAIAKSDLFLVLVSPQSEHSPWIATETAFAVSQAQKGRPRVVPVLLSRKAKPPLLAQHVQGIELFDEQRWQRQLDDLVESLRRESGRQRDQKAEALKAELQYLGPSREALEKEMEAQAYRREANQRDVWASMIAAGLAAFLLVAMSLATLQIFHVVKTVSRWILPYGLGVLASAIAFSLSAWFRRRLSERDPHKVRK